MTKRKRPDSISIKTEGSVSVSMDDVGRDKVIVNEIQGEKTEDVKCNCCPSQRNTSPVKSIVEWISAVPVIAKLVETIRQLW